MFSDSWFSDDYFAKSFWPSDSSGTVVIAARDVTISIGPSHACDITVQPSRSVDLSIDP